MLSQSEMGESEVVNLPDIEVQLEDDSNNCIDTEESKIQPTNTYKHYSTN